MYLEDVVFPSDAAAETLISCSPVLEDLKLSLHRDDVVVVLRVYSQSLKSFTLKRAVPVYAINGAHTVLVDTPRLVYMSLIDYQFKSFKIISMSDYVKVDLDVDFELMRDELSERNIVYDLLNNFSGVRNMTISWTTLKVCKVKLFTSSKISLYHSFSHFHVLFTLLFARSLSIDSMT